MTDNNEARIEFMKVCEYINDELKDVPGIEDNPDWKLFKNRTLFYMRVWVGCDYYKINDCRVYSKISFWKDVAHNIAKGILDELPITNTMITSFE